MKKVSSKTHTKQQLNDYANQHNPNNKAFKARKDQRAKAKSKDSLWKIEKEYGFMVGCDDHPNF